MHYRIKQIWVRVCGLLLIPGRAQFRNWSLPSKVGYVSYFLGVIGFAVTVAIFFYQESSSETQQYQIAATAVATEAIASQLTSTPIVAADDLIDAVECAPRSLGCLKPQQVLMPSGIGKLFEFESPRNLLVYYRPGFEYLVLDKVVSRIQDYQLFVIPDRLAKNERPKNLLSGSPRDLSVAEYVRFANGKVPGIFLMGVSGAGGGELFVALFAPTKSGYRNLFGDEWLTAENNRFIFEDVDGDGVHDLVAESGICELSMSTLTRTHSGPMYKVSERSTDEVLGVLDKSIVGSELATAFRKWRQAGCPRTVEDDGELWRDIDESMSAHRIKDSVLSIEVRQRRGEVSFPVYLNESSSALIGRDLDLQPSMRAPDPNVTIRQPERTDARSQ